MLLKSLHSSVFVALVLITPHCSIAQWVQTSKGINGSGVLATAKQGPYFFAGTTGGIFRADNKSESLRWTDENSGMYGDTVYTFATIGSTIFTGTDKGVFVSTNYGLSWVAANTGLPPSSKVYSLATSDSILFAGTDISVFRSTDEGVSWTLSNVGLNNAKVSALAALDSNVVAGTSVGTFVSNNNGTNWSKVSDPSVSFVSAFAVSDTIIFASSYGGLFRSSDRGISWATCDSGIALFHISCIAVRGNQLLAGGTGYSGLFQYGMIYASTNSGISWKRYSDTLKTNSPITTITGNPNATISSIIGTYGTGIFNTDGYEVNNGLINSTITSLTVLDSDFFAVSFSFDFLNGVYRSTDGGESWTSCIAGLPVDTIFPASYYATYSDKTSFSVDRQNIYLALSGFGMYRSTNWGKDWTALKKFSLPQGVNVDRTILSLLVDDTNIAVGTAYGVEISSDGGLNWEYAANSLSDVNSLIKMNSVLFAGTAQGIFQSSDNGLHWTLLNNNLSYVAALLVKGANLFAAARGGVYISTDQGNTWVLVSNGLPYNSTYQGYETINNLVSYGGIIFAGSASEGVYFSTNNGSEWVAANQGISNLDVGSLIGNGKYLLAGNGNSYASLGVYRRPLSEMIGQSAVAKPEATTQSLRCYPNPLSQSTTISLSPATSGYAEISIVNQLGVEVARIFSGELDAGEHSFTWDATSSRGVGPLRPTGMNECVVRMNGQVRSLPLAVLR